MSVDKGFSRRAFLRMGGLSLAALSMTPLSAFAQSNLEQVYEKQLKLIDQIRGYATQTLGLKLGDSFYTQWEQENGMLHYLYVSENNEVKVPYGLRDYQYFGTDARTAYQLAERYEQRGFHTMVYRTAGTSATRLNKTLLSYPLESIAIIVFHEALHVHFRNINKILPLALEEAACDVFTRNVSKDFEPYTDLIGKKETKKLLKINDKIYKAINSNLDKLKSSDTNQYKVFLKCRNQIMTALKKGNKYQRNRFNYEVNNAFFVRNSFYSEYYFDLVKLYKSFKSPKEFTAYCSNLPNNLEQSLEIIGQRINKKIVVS